MFATELKQDKAYSSTLRIFPERLRIKLEALPESHRIHVNEIRLRVGSPVMVCIKGEYQYLCDIPGSVTEPSYIITQQDLRYILELATGNSVFMHQEDIKKGFITIR
ncbi:MAG TPA: hypothetical protein DDZ89_11805, partial [Clostridiales bacterium]|nr:hypothetical protein [Clostridiales bacterium]